MLVVISKCDSENLYDWKRHDYCTSWAFFKIFFFKPSIYTNRKFINMNTMISFNTMSDMM